MNPAERKLAEMSHADLLAEAEKLRLKLQAMDYRGCYWDANIVEKLAAAPEAATPSAVVSAREVTCMIALEIIARAVGGDWGELGYAENPELLKEVRTICEVIGMEDHGDGYGFDWSSAQDAMVERMGGRSFALIDPKATDDAPDKAPSAVAEKTTFAFERNTVGRVKIGADDPLYKAFRPSPETIAAIEKNEAANAQGLAAIREMMVGHVTNWPEPKKFGTALALVDKTLHAALTPSAVGGVDRMREALEGLFDQFAMSIVRGDGSFTQGALIDAIIALTGGKTSPERGTIDERHRYLIKRNADGLLVGSTDDLGAIIPPGHRLIDTIGEDGLGLGIAFYLKNRAALTTGETSPVQGEG